MVNRGIITLDEARVDQLLLPSSLKTVSTVPIEPKQLTKYQSSKDAQPVSDFDSNIGNRNNSACGKDIHKKNNSGIEEEIQPEIDEET